MNCPKCDGSQLEHLTIPVKDPKNPATESKLDLDRCGACGGTWFDPGEIDQYLKSRTQDAAPAGLSSIVGAAKDSKPGKCPRCAVALSRAHSTIKAGINVDRCGKCQGVWFDGGELQQAARTQAPINDSLKAFFGNI